MADRVRAGRRDRLLFTGSVVLNLLVVLAPSTPGGESALPHLDKLVHMLVFAAVALTGRRVGLGALPLAVALTAYAPAGELAQHALLPDRSGDPGDVVADLVGTAIGLVGGGAARGRGNMGS